MELKDALKKANLDSSSVSYIETHGTGTSLGDPIETEAIKAVFNQQDNNNSPCVLGAVKSNIGHLEAAAGIAGLIKLILMFEYQKIPPQLHFEKVNPRIELDSDKFIIPKVEMLWERSERKRIAGISAFGFSGTNAHVIVEEGPPKSFNAPGLQEHNKVLFISARTQKALISLAKSYCEYLSEESKLKNLPISEICNAAATKRTHYEYRVAVIGKSHSEFIEKLSALNTTDVKKVSDQASDITFFFPKDIPAWNIIINSIPRDNKEFQNIIKECDQIIKEITNTSLFDKIIQKKSLKKYLIDISKKIGTSILFL